MSLSSKTPNNLGTYSERVKICRVPDETEGSTLEAIMAETQNSTQALSNLRKMYEEEDDPKRRDLLRALMKGEEEIAAGRFVSAEEVFGEILDSTDFRSDEQS